jgi:hypothetical protein
VFDAASGWTLVAGLVGIAVVVACVALVWRARAADTRRGVVEPVPAALVALGTILIVVGVFFGAGFTGYSLIGGGVVIAVLSVIFRSRPTGR